MGHGCGSGKARRRVEVAYFTFQLFQLLGQLLPARVPGEVPDLLGRERAEAGLVAELHQSLDRQVGIDLGP